MEIGALEVIVLSIELHRHAIILQSRKYHGGDSVIEGRHPHAQERALARQGGLQDGQILQVHIAIGDKPRKKRAPEQSPRIVIRPG